METSWRRTLVVKAIKLVAGLTIASFIGYALYASWPTVVHSLGTIGVDHMLGGVFLISISSLLQMLAWLQILKSFEAHTLDTRVGAATYTVSQVSKYVPGSIWPALLQARMGRRYGIPQSQMYSSFVIQLAGSLSSAAILSPLVLLGDIPAWLKGASLGTFVAGIVLGLLTIRQNLVFHIAEFIPAFGRLKIAKPSDPRRLVIALALLLSSWVVAGLQVWLLAAPLGATLKQLPFVVGANALSWAIGLVIVFLPAGAGAREAVVVVTLGVIIGSTQSLAIAVLTRFLQVISDLILAAVLGKPLIRGRAFGSKQPRV